MSEMSRQARLSKLRGLLEQECYTSQQELADALTSHDVKVSQSTLSKDLLALGAIRRRAEDGSLVYALAADGDFRAAALEKLARMCAELLSSLQSSGNQIVVRTPPGGAQYLAACFDAARLPGVMGTIAGDDTILIIGTDAAATSRIIRAITEMTRTGRPTKELDHG